MADSQGTGAGTLPVERGTYVQKAYSEIRRLIIAGEIEPGAKLVVRPLAEQLGLSPTPIKGALAGLERDGFLIAVAHRGYFVPTVEAEDMREIFELREVLDGIAARKVAARADRAPVVGRLWELYDRQDRTVEAADTSQYSEVNVAFHQLIWVAAGNNRLGHLAENLLGQLRLATGASARAPGRMRCAMQEHRSIVAAIESGDPAEAEREARGHVRLSAEAFLQGSGLPVAEQSDGAGHRDP